MTYVNKVVNMTAGYRPQSCRLKYFLNRLIIARLRTVVRKKRISFEGLNRSRGIDAAIISPRWLKECDCFLMLRNEAIRLVSR